MKLSRRRRRRYQPRQFIATPTGWPRWRDMFECSLDRAPRKRFLDTLMRSALTHGLRAGNASVNVVLTDYDCLLGVTVWSRSGRRHAVRTSVRPMHYRRAVQLGRSIAARLGREAWRRAA